MAASVALIGSVGQPVTGSISGTTITVTVTLTDGADVGDIVYVQRSAAAGSFIGEPTDSKGNTYANYYTTVTTPLVAGDTVSVVIESFFDSEIGVAVAVARIRGLNAPVTYHSGGGNGGLFLTPSPIYASSFGVTPTAGREVVLLGIMGVVTNDDPNSAGFTRVVAGWTTLATVAGGAAVNGTFFTSADIGLNLAAQVVSAASGGYLIDANISYVTAQQWSAGLDYFEGSPPSTQKVSQAREPVSGSLCIAYTDNAGAVKVARYNDALPPAVAATVTVETSGGTGVSLQARADGSFDLVYAHTSGTIKRRTSRDGGRTWSVASTVATGYTDCDHLVDESRGLALVALWKESASEWYLSVGTLNAAGTAWSYTTPALFVSSAKRGGSLLRRGDGAYEFAYTTTADVVTVVRNRELSSAGAGTWS